MSQKTIFTGAGVAIVTPMNPDGSVNYDVFREMIEDQIKNGTDAIIACGTTGESSTLDNDEHLNVIKVAIEQTAGRVPVIAGTGSNDTAYCIQLSKEAEALGADALLLVTPYYNKTSQRGLIAHYTAVANAVSLPIILYNVPSRTGVDIKPATVVELSKVPNIVALKQANGDFSATAQIAAECDIDIYSGNDDQIVPILSLGGKGVISVLSNVAPRQTHDICQKWFDGDVAGSLALQLEYLELANMLFCDVNPIPVKEAMNMMGWNVGECRLPLYSTSDENKAKLAATLQKYGLKK
ncbi:MAG: 4-hydroxy-tetrahydrodipicolinate synthase [Clostridia bacterium]|nr:4-hydroxy-tetrahydrodipicolinate synthase [Clostridia bacterium]